MNQDHRDKLFQSSPKKEGSVNPVVAAVAGVIIGASAVAGGVALSNEKNQAKIKKGIQDVKKTALDVKKNIESSIDEGKSKIEKVKNDLTGSIDEGKSKIEKAKKDLS
jgi:uncharacterized membrane-anchored protein YhcB (DUF1043 family)